MLNHYFLARGYVRRGVGWPAMKLGDPDHLPQTFGVWIRNPTWTTFQRWNLTWQEPQKIWLMNERDSYFMAYYTSPKNDWVGFHSPYMGVSENSGTPKSSILIWFSIINHPFGASLFLEAHNKRVPNWVTWLTSVPFDLRFRQENGT